jgi:hypothetical protein
MDRGKLAEDGGRRLKRLDEERLETLRGWSESLAGDRREEIRGAGRAIRILIDEIERLNGELRNASQRPDLAPVEQLHKDAVRPEGTAAPDDLVTTLRSRLRGRARRRQSGKLSADEWQSGPRRPNPFKASDGNPGVRRGLLGCYGARKLDCGCERADWSGTRFRTEMRERDRLDRGEVTDEYARRLSAQESTPAWPYAPRSELQACS